MSSMRKLTLVMSMLCVALGCLSSVALASAPEVPELTEPLEVTGSSAYVRGYLNPNASEPREAGTYQFVYRASTTKECQGAGEAKMPETPALSMGLPHEETPFEQLTGLAPHTEYAVCLVVTETGKTSPAVSAPVTFKTLTPPETPETTPATDITGTSATLNGVLNPNAPGEAGEQYKFYYQQSATECRGEGSKEAPEFANLPANGNQQEAVADGVTGLLPDTTYTYCIQALNSAFETALGQPVTFQTPAAEPTIAKLAYTGLTSTEATVTAEVDPGALITTYSVEYEPGKTITKELPASRTAVPVTQRLTGLSPETTYHVTLTAHNDNGTAQAAIDLKTSAPTTKVGNIGGCPNSKNTGVSSALPECRAAELVSPSEELGETYDPGGTNNRAEDTTTRRPFRASGAGSSVAYLADPTLIGGDGSSAKGKGNEYLATRGPNAGPGGWESVNITPPTGARENASREREYEAFSPDLSVGIVTSEQQLMAADPSPQGPEGCNILYAHESSGYHALFSETTTPEYCGLSQVSQGRDGQLIYAGETTDHGQKFFQTPAALVTPAVETEGVGSNLYDSVGGTLSVVNLLPENDEVAPNATYGGPSGLLTNAPDFSNAVSPDGSRAIWSTVFRGETIKGEPAARPTSLYVRENPTQPSATTVQLDAVQAGASGSSGGGMFWGASRDDSKVFFTDCSRLTKDSTADDAEGCQHATGEDEVRTGNDLYEYDFSKPVGARLSDMTVDENGSDPLGADVQGVLGVSEDGTYVYFAAGGALTSGVNSRGEVATTRKCEEGGGSETEGVLPAGIGCNLYVIHYDGTEWEAPVFIAALAKRDDRLAVEKLNDPLSGSDAFAGDWIPDLGSRTAETTPDGRNLVFESTQRLTGYDNSNVGNDQGGEGGVEVFEFNTATKRLACASCDPSGTPPNAALQSGIKPSFAPYVPVSSSNTFMHRWINNAGDAVFFDSSQPLVSGDGNGTQDVYEWAAEGSPSCAVATSKYGGCVFLLSGGESTDFSFLVDVSESGNDVFLTHRGQLDGVGPVAPKVHLYDLRIDGGYTEAGSGCAGATCATAPPAPTVVPTPSSVALAGIGNFSPQPVALPKPKTAAQIRAERLGKALKACKANHKKSKKRRVACERLAKKRYGPPSKRAKKKG